MLKSKQEQLLAEILHKQEFKSPIATHEHEEVAVAEWKHPAPEVLAIPKPVAKRIALSFNAETTRAYHTLAKKIGFYIPDITAELLKLFLVDHDIPVFSMSEVVTYMDNKADKEGRTDYASRNKLGWGWLPLRDKDNIKASFGRQMGHHQVHVNGHYSHEWKPASDYYAPANNRSERTKAYDKPVPLHALQKVEVIEEEFGDQVVFFVSDYATAEWAKPDPFLMVAIIDPQTRAAGARMVIDFWDEPGFGLERMLKPSE